MPGLLRESDDILWKIKGDTIHIGRRPLIMGILNATPDSFYDGGRYKDPHQAIEQGLRLSEEGADLLDIGGLSTRPGSQPIPWEEEAERILPVISHLSPRLKIPISVDTYRAEVARLALEAGARIVNDVSALKLDAEMGPVVAASGAGLILMHMRGVPSMMQQDTHYDSLLEEIFDFLKERLDFATSSGIEEKQILIDPGIGFGKSAEQNMEILRHLEFFEDLKRPILVGPSRKSFIGHVLDQASEERLSGTLACIAVSFYHGARVVRVHDVLQTNHFLKMLEAFE
jgi:dihydropteroate synthase